MENNDLKLHCYEMMYIVLKHMILKFKSIVECINSLGISKSSMYRMLKNNNKLYNKTYKVYDKK